MAVMMYGPDLPTELSEQNERHLILMAAAQYALGKSDTDFILASSDREEKIIYYHNLLMTSCWSISALLYSYGREFFQNEVSRAEITMLSTSCIFGWKQPKVCLISKCYPIPPIHI